MKKILDAEQLKILATISMFLDHVGYFIFPDILWLRYIGRLAFPIFAYFIAEGSLHTRDRKQYFLRIAGLGVFCLIVTYLFEGLLYGNILITFAISVYMIESLENFINCIKQNESGKKKSLNIFVMILKISLVFIINRYISIDYGFMGIMIPVLCYFTIKYIPKYTIIALATGLCLLSLQIGGYQILCLIGILPLLLYNEMRGNRGLKKVFYLFYPLHIAFIQALLLLPGI